MKTEDGSEDVAPASTIPGLSAQSFAGPGARPDASDHGGPASHAPGNTSSSGPNSVTRTQAQQLKRTVCDHCRRRRIRCDGQLPCQQCINANLTCKRDHVPRKRGPKRGHGRVINELRAREARASRESSVDVMMDDSGPESRSAMSSYPSTPSPKDISWRNNTSDPRNAPEPRSAFTTDQYQPNTRSFLHLVPQCVELYYEHIYPIMPLLYMPSIRTMIARPMDPSEKNLIYALCALVGMHMSGKSLHVQGPESWEDAGRYFLDECISTRQSYDFMEDMSLNAVISSFWLSTSFFEINQNRKSWLYLREAVTLALDIGLHNDSNYIGLSPEDALCRQRVFWILFVTERSFAILRNKPITFKKTPSLPTTRHSYESHDIHTGFLQLVSSYTPLDESFVTAWNDGSDPRVSATTYLALQNLLAQPPAFLQRSRATTPSSEGAAIYSAPRSAPTNVSSNDEADEEFPMSEPTAIQKADLLITQQWLRLIVWQSSFRQGLLSWAAPHESMHFAFPLAIARSTAGVLQSLPSSAVEVHGMGIFEKIFEIGTWCINVLGACDSATANGTSMSEVGPNLSFGTSGGGVMGMDFLPGGGDLGVLGLSRKGVAVDPLEFFVRTLSATPNSRTQFAERLMMFAQERPGGMRMALTPALASPVLAPDDFWSTFTQSRSGSIIGEVKDEADPESSEALYANPLDIPIVDDPSLQDFGSAGYYNKTTLGTTNLAREQMPLLTVHEQLPSLTTSVPLTDWKNNDMTSQDNMGTYGITSPTIQTNPSSAVHSGTATPNISRQDSGNAVCQERQLGNGIVMNEEAILSRIQDREHHRRSGSYQDLGVW